MIYNKPELWTLGDAMIKIQNVHDKPAPEISDSPLDTLQSNAAYDLDD